MIKKINIIFFSSFFLIKVHCFSAIDVYIKIIQEGKQIDIGISKFFTKNPSFSNIANEMEDVVTKDLMFTRIFRITTPGWRYLPNKEVSQKYKQYGINVVVCGEVDVQQDTYILKGTIYDVETMEIIYENTFRSKDMRFISHLFSDNIILRFTGEYGVCTTQIAFVNDATGFKEIYIMDYDGKNLKNLTNDNSINLYPRISPNGKEILYTSYKAGNPDLYFMSIDGKYTQFISMQQGLNITANWAPDGNKIIVSQTRAKHSPDLFILFRDGSLYKRISNSQSIDISGYFAPNNREIVFISDRAGYPQMYISDIDGTNIRRLYTSKYTDSPCWSPKANKIVFSMMTEKNIFDIFIYDITKNTYYRLTQDSGSNESPFFSPDGRFIVFSSNRFGKYELFTMFIDGSNQRRITQIKGNSRMPCWGPTRSVLN